MENPQTPARILVVDDEPDIRNILHILLSSRGYAVDEAENGLRAVACVRAQPDYDLIIMDIMMPGMDGVAACTEIRQHSVAPILFLTAKAQPGDMSDAYGSGGDDYLVKPFSNHELFLRVESLIRRYRVYHGKGDAPTVIDALEINRDKGTVCKNGRAVEMTRRSLSCCSTSSPTAARPCPRASSMRTSGMRNSCRARPTPSWCTSSSCAKSSRTIRPTRR